MQIALIPPFKLRTGALLVMLGYLLRAIPVLFSFSVNFKFYLALGGHFLLGFGIPFISFTPSKIAEHWFSENHRLMAITLISTGNLIGLMVSYLLMENLLSFGFDIGEQVNLNL